MYVLFSSLQGQDMQEAYVRSVLIRSLVIDVDLQTLCQHAGLIR